MTGAPIDGSLRRPVLEDQDKGNVIPDSRKKLDDAPIAVMEPGVEDLALQFTDKKGLTDEYGNIYQGYGNSGGSSFTVNSDPPSSIDSEADDANDGDILVFVDAEEKYLPFAYEDVGLPRVSTDNLPTNGEILVFFSAFQKYVPQNLSEAGIAPVTGDVPDPNDILVFDDATDRYKPMPQIIQDFFSFLIPQPENGAYIVCRALPFEVTFNGSSFGTTAGSATVTFPTGTYAAGSQISITVSGATGSTRNLSGQLNFTRNLGIVVP